MTNLQNSTADTDVVIGAGVGGLSAAIALAGRGRRVLVLERAATAGGKMRSLPSAAGPVDTGPTVLTLRDVFEDMFARAGGRLADYVTLLPQPILARHFWPDGSTLDLGCDEAQNAAAIAAFSGAASARQYLQFEARTRAMYCAFDAPMMRAARPDLLAIARAAIVRPQIWPALLPHMSLQRWLSGQFSDPRLVQLFGRYATYVGGMPNASPAVLALIWQAEAQGVWAVQGGMGALAAGMERFARALGVQFAFRTSVQEITLQNGRASGVLCAGGQQIAARSVTFNGDPAALFAGNLGVAAKSAVPKSAVHPRSLSAYVWAFASPVAEGGPDLAHHNVFFGSDPARDFGAIARGQMAEDPTLYICAQDRSNGAPARGSLERFEIIMNAAAASATSPPPLNEASLCQTRVFSQLSRFGLTFSAAAHAENLTTPQGFAALFPASQGAIYGRSPQSLIAPMLRPCTRTRITGLYLAGGGAHPGAGVPMAALSGLHAAETIMSGQISAPAPKVVAMRGGMSTG
jgi:1-hydroxycarotenoid 3,4-desaturase